MIKILTILGTRPEAIKLAPVIKTLESYPEKFYSIVCVTAQHREMLDQVLKVFHITPHYDLNIMKYEQSLTDVTTEVVQKVGDVLDREIPDLVLVQGDTTTTFVASLAAFYRKIKIGHVEAGLRSFDKYQPFPEEMNRRLTGALCDYHFAPTDRARDNLLKEGVKEESILVTGNTGIDALFMVLAQLNNDTCKKEAVKRYLPGLDDKRVILVTVHRRENFGPIFEEICRALREIVERNCDVVIVFPVHPNPNIQTVARRHLKGFERIKLVEPLEYLFFVYLMERANLILTDSGGIQEEAPSLGKRVLVVRNVTERGEAVEGGTSKLVGTKAATIVDEVQKALDQQLDWSRPDRFQNPFGDGKASERIVGHILNCFS